MRQVKLPVLTACLLALLAPAWAFALNLGDINLKSEPGQPLEAEIPLSGVAPDELDSLSVGLADVAGFRWAGIDWTPTLNRLQFELQRGRDGAAHIRVHSDEALRTPLLHFLLKVAWSSGRLFREYTLELDIPPDTYADTESQTGLQRGVGSAADDDQGDVTAALRGSRRYEVVRNDTLWDIARELRSDASVSIQQMMLALLRTNPDAFSYKNINWLKAGEVLWIPSDFEMQALPAAEAFAEVLVHNNVWRGTRGLPAVEAGWVAGAGRISVDGGLRLVAVREGYLENGNSVPARSDRASGEQSLALANERIEELSQENIELEDRLSESETIIEDLRRLVELKDNELAALQAREISEQGDPGPDLAARIGDAYDSASEALSGTKLQSIYDSMKQNWQWVLACLAVLLALVGWLLLRRKAAHDGVGSAAPTASDSPDVTTVAGDGGSDAPEEGDSQEEGADTEDPELVDDMEQAEPDAVDESDAEEALISDESEDEGDMLQNKLDLARAYLELGDVDNVQSILDEVLADGNAAQKEEARQLLARIESL